MGGKSNHEILEVLGEEAAVALAEEFAGTRLYVPHRVDDSHQIVQAIGMDAAAKLVQHFAPDTIRVPLLRELRAQYHRKNGLSHSRIAVRLGMTEPAVEQMLKRIRERAKQ